MSGLSFRIPRYTLWISLFLSTVIVWTEPSENTQPGEKNTHLSHIIKISAVIPLRKWILWCHWSSFLPDKLLFICSCRCMRPTQHNSVIFMKGARVIAPPRSHDSDNHMAAAPHKSIPCSLWTAVQQQSVTSEPNVTHSVRNKTIRRALFKCLAWNSAMKTTRFRFISLTSFSGIKSTCRRPKIAQKFLRQVDLVWTQATFCHLSLALQKQDYFNEMVWRDLTPHPSPSSSTSSLPPSLLLMSVQSRSLSSPPTMWPTYIHIYMHGDVPTQTW